MRGFLLYKNKYFHIMYRDKDQLLLEQAYEMLLEVALSTNNIRRYLIKYNLKDLPERLQKAIKNLSIDMPFLNPALDHVKTYKMFISMYQNLLELDKNEYHDDLDVYSITRYQNDEEEDEESKQIKEYTRNYILRIIDYKYNAYSSILKYNKVKQLFDRKYPGGLFNLPIGVTPVAVFKEINLEIKQRENIKMFKRLGGVEQAQKSIIYQDSYCLIVQPSSFEMSKVFFGAPIRRDILDGSQKPGANWCTASGDSDEKYKEYTENSLLTYIQKKNTENLEDILYAVKSDPLAGAEDQIDRFQRTTNALSYIFETYLKNKKTNNLQESLLNLLAKHGQRIGIPETDEIRNQQNVTVTNINPETGRGDGVDIGKLILNIYGEVKAQNFVDIANFLCYTYYRKPFRST